MQAPFSESARSVLSRAVGEAEALHHDHLGTGHVVLALLRDSRGRAASVLDALGVDREQAIPVVLAGLPEGAAPPMGERPYSSNAVKMLQSAMALAVEQRADVEPDHLLIAIASNPDSTGMRLLARYAKPSAIIAEARRQRGSGPS